MKELTEEERHRIYEEIFTEMSSLVTRQMYPYMPSANGVKIESSMRKLKALLEMVV